MSTLFIVLVCLACEIYGRGTALHSRLQQISRLAERQHPLLVDSGLMYYSLQHKSKVGIIALRTLVMLLMGFNLQQVTRKPSRTRQCLIQSSAAIVDSDLRDRFGRSILAIDSGIMASVCTLRALIMMDDATEAIPEDVSAYSWREVWINKEDAGTASHDDPCIPMSGGLSVLCIEDVATAAERRLIVESCSRAASEQRERRYRSHWDKKDVRTLLFPQSDLKIAVDRLEQQWLSREDSGWAAGGMGLVRLNEETDIPSIANKILREAILPRVLRIVDAQFPSLVRNLFEGAASLAELYCTSPDGQIFLDHGGQQKHVSNLEFAFQEPAINVYIEGGQFKPHCDRQALTVLIPISDDGAFKGGGTGFWSGGCDAQTTDPTICLRPPAGTAMLFVGNVTHAGMEVEDGERVVLVASFSRRDA